MNHRQGPTFVNIGPGRCATSWLHEILLAHPEVTMAKVKEAEFFNHNYEKGPDWYDSQFPPKRNAAVGEISNCYYTEPNIAQRILDYSPDFKIIVNIREPYSLLQSFHGFGIRRGLELPALEDALDIPIGKLMGAGYEYRKQKKQLTDGDRVRLLEAVLISGFVKPFLDLFPRENLYLFVFERLKHDQETVIRELYEFLGVEKEFLPPVTTEIVNASIAPKSKYVARMATRVSYFLRRLGAYGLLSQLHQSRMIKKMFFSEAKKNTTRKVDPRSVLDDETRKVLDQEIVDMIHLHPPLERWWGHLLPAETGGKTALSRG